MVFDQLNSKINIMNDLKAVNYKRHMHKNEIKCFVNVRRNTSKKIDFLYVN